jgi:hypothetical protein
MRSAVVKNLELLRPADASWFKTKVAALEANTDGVESPRVAEHVAE